VQVGKKLYAREKTGDLGIILDPINGMAKTTAVKRCEFCGHSRAAHVDGVQCALCSCRSERRSFIQQSFAFRSMLSEPAGPMTRKR
jgi:hypothetical protein